MNTVGSKGESPLFTAAKSGYSDICRLLLDAGADPDFILPANQHTPLITAASNDNDDVIKVLLKVGIIASQPQLCEFYLTGRSSVSWRARIKINLGEG